MSTKKEQTIRNVFSAFGFMIWHRQLKETTPMIYQIQTPATKDQIIFRWANEPRQIKVNLTEEQLAIQIKACNSDLTRQRAGNIITTDLPVSFEALQKYLDDAYKELSTWNL